MLFNVSVVIISSGVDNRGEVDDDTPPKPFSKLLVKFKEDGEFDRTSNPPLVMDVSVKKCLFYSTFQVFLF